MTGRPELEPTADQQNAVEVAAGGGCTQEEIADYLGIDVKTLTKHFEKELERGANRRKVAVVLAMYQAAIKGSVSAQKSYLLIDPTLKPLAPKEVKEKALGKKAQAMIDAKRIDGIYAPPPPPKLVVNNGP